MALGATDRSFSHAVASVLSMHTRATLERFGAQSMIPTALAIALVKETGPLVTGCPLLAA